MGAPNRASERPWLQLAAVSFVQLAASIDLFAVTVALPQIQTDLDGTTRDLQWTVNVYVLATAAALMGAGRIGDLIGRRRVLLTGTVVFAIGSLTGGVADSFAVLMAGRATAGAGAGLIAATGLSIVATAFPDKGRGRAIGVWSAVGAVGAATGPVVGGILTANLSWRWIFYINPFLAAVTAALVIAVVPESRDERTSGGFDVLGFLTLTGGACAIAFALVQGSTLRWLTPGVLTAGIGGLALLAWFARLDARADSPILDLARFRNRRYAGTAVVAFTSDFAFAAVMFYLTLYMQDVIGLDADAAGAMFLLLTVTFIALSPIAGRAAENQREAPLMLAGMVVVAASALVIGLLDIDSGLLLVAVGLLLAGVGQALAFSPAGTAAMNAIPQHAAGVGSSVISEIRQFGQLTGLAITAAVFNGVEKQALDDQTTDGSFVTGLGAVMITVVVVSLIGVAGALAARLPAQERGSPTQTR